MGQIVRLGAHSRSPERPRATASEAPPQNLLVGVLVTVITLALGVILFVAWPRTPSHLSEGPATAEVTDDSAVFSPRMSEAQLQTRRAEREKEDSAVFGQAPSAPAYQTPSR